MARTFDKRIARIVGEAGVIEADALAKIIAAAAEENKPLSTMLVSQGAIDENELLGLLCLRLRVPPINLHDCTLDTDVVRLIPKEIATNHRIVPLSRIENVLTVAVSNPSDVVTLDQVRNSTGCELRLVLSLDDAIEKVLYRIHNPGAAQLQAVMGEMDDSDIEIEHQDENELDLEAMARD